MALRAREGKNAWAKGKKCAFGRQNAGLVIYKVYVRQDNDDRAALPSSFPGEEGNCTLFNSTTKLSQVDKSKDDLFACESLV